jgi:hypothetical protein
MASTAPTVTVVAPDATAERGKRARMPLVVEKHAKA